MNMKRTIIATLMALMCAVTFAQNAASDFTIGADGVITKYNGWDAAVVIPETINGIRVTAIGNNAFASSDLTSVTIPNGVISIGNEAFTSNKLTSVTIPDSVTSIGYRAFRNNQLASVTIPGNNVIIGSEAFASNPITSVTLGNNHALSSADVVPKVNNNRSESSLYYDYACNDRKAGTYTANRAVAAEKTEADFKFIETQYGAFITNYTGSSGNRLEIPARLGNLSVKAISGLNRKQISRVRIPDSVTYIGDSAFSENFGMTEITIPDSVTFIGEKAFYENRGMTSVTIGNGVTYIGNNAFFRNRLTSVTIPDSVTYLSGFGNNQLTEITIPNSVTIIGNGAFSGNRLTSVTIPDSVTTIKMGAFEGGLTSVTIGANVTLEISYHVSSFGSGFDDFYNNNGRAAGTYTRPDAYSRNWTKQ